MSRLEGWPCEEKVWQRVSDRKARRAQRHALTERATLASAKLRFC